MLLLWYPFILVVWFNCFYQKLVAKTKWSSELVRHCDTGHTFLEDVCFHSSLATILRKRDRDFWGPTHRLGSVFAGDFSKNPVPWDSIIPCWKTHHFKGEHFVTGSLFFFTQPASKSKLANQVNDHRCRITWIPCELTAGTWKSPLWKGKNHLKQSFIFGFPC